MIDANDLIWTDNNEAYSGEVLIGRVQPVGGTAGLHEWTITGIACDPGAGQANSVSNAKRALSQAWSRWLSSAKLSPH